MPPHAKPSQVQVSLEQRITNIEKLLKWLGGFSGLSMIGLLSFAFFLGSLNTKVSSSEATINKVHEDVSTGERSLLVRTSLIESRLSSIDTKLSTMDTKLDDLVNFRERTGVKVKTLPEPVPKQ
jgi:hypothetical protein